MGLREIVIVAFRNTDRSPFVVSISKGERIVWKIECRHIENQLKTYHSFSRRNLDLPSIRITEILVLFPNFKYDPTWISRNQTLNLRESRKIKTKKKKRKKRPLYPQNSSSRGFVTCKKRSNTMQPPLVRSKSKWPPNRRALAPKDPQDANYAHQVVAINQWNFRNANMVIQSVLAATPFPASRRRS